MSLNAHVSALACKDPRMTDLAIMQRQIHKTAVEHGWWEPQEVQDAQEAHGPAQATIYAKRSFGDLVALCHSELSEALEAFREHGLEEWEAKGGKPEGAFTELGDCIIRILDIAGFYGVDMQSIVERKMTYNESRPYRHGNKNL